MTGDRYPSARNAIAVCEACSTPWPEVCATLRESRIGLDRLVRLFHESAAEIGTRRPLLPQELAAVREFDSTDFRRYLMAVVYGAM